MAEPKIAHGSLRKNDNKKTESSPDLWGSFTFDRDVRAGTKVSYAAWQKRGDDGKTWYSQVLSEMPAPRAPQYAPQRDYPAPNPSYGAPPHPPQYPPRYAPPRSDDGLDDEIPF